jgi:hypothetical protein
MHISSFNLKRNQILENGRLSHTIPLKMENEIILNNNKITPLIDGSLMA